nr:putative Ig domain-containing protein [uncultured Arsenicibacter sp.]
MHLSVSHYIRLALTVCFGLFTSMLVGVNAAAIPETPVAVAAPSPPTLAVPASSSCGTPVSVTATCNAGTVGFIATGGSAAGNIYTFSTPGTYTLGATCTDGTGTSLQTTVNVTVSAGNPPPTLTPSSATVLQGGSNVSILATGCQGGIIQYVGATGAGVNTVAPGSIISVGTTTLGTKIISALCSRNGCVSESVSATVTVRSGTPTGPTVASAIATQYGVAGTGFTYLIPSSTFADPKNSPLTLTVSGLPDGLFFNGLIINGPLTTPGNSLVTVTATNNQGQSVSTAFNLVVSPAATLISSGTLTCAAPSVTLVASGGTAYRFSAGAAQVGTSGAAIVTTTGLYSVTATGPNGYESVASTRVTADISSCNFSLIAPQYNCLTGEFYFRTQGGNGTPITFSAVGVTGPTTTAGPYTVLPASDAGPFTLVAVQSGVTVTYTWDWKAFCAQSNVPPITTGLSNKTAVVGTIFVYNTSPSFVDPNSKPLSFTATGLPAGVNITQEGLISGTPSVTGTFSVVVTAKDQSNQPVSASFVLSVLPAGTTPPPAQPLALSAIINSCSPGALYISMAASGGNGSSYEYAAVGVTGWTVSPGPFKVDVYGDTGPLNLMVRNANNPTVIVNYVLPIPDCSRPTPVTVTPPPSTTGTPPLSITAASINCTTRVVSLSTAGGDGSPYLKRIVLVTNFVAANEPLVLDEGIFLEQNQSNILLQVSQNGVPSALFTYNFRNQCPITTTPPPTSTTSTAPTQACASPANTLGQPLALSATFTCNTGSTPHVMSFLPTGGVNAPNTVFEFFSPGVTGWTVNCSAPIDLGIDSRNYTVMVRQRDVNTGNILAQTSVNLVSPCTPKSGAREAAGKEQELDVTVLGNPTLNDYVEVTIRNAAGKALHLQVSDMVGRQFAEKSVEQAGAQETQRVSIGRSAGIYFLTVKTATQAKTVKIVRQ